MKTLGNKINELRKQAGLTQDELAEKMDVSPQAVSKWENDLSMPDVNMLVKLSDLFSVTLDYLLKDKEPRPQEIALENIPEQPAPRKNINKMSLYIKVHEPHGDDVNLKFPLAMVKGKMIKKLIAKYAIGVDADLDFDTDQLIEMVESGQLSQIVDITEKNGETVKIYIE